MTTQQNTAATTSASAFFVDPAEKARFNRAVQSVVWNELVDTTCARLDRGMHLATPFNAPNATATAAAATAGPATMPPISTASSSSSSSFSSFSTSSSSSSSLLSAAAASSFSRSPHVTRPFAVPAAGATVLTAPIPRSIAWTNIATRLECEAEEDDEAAQQGLARAASSAASAVTHFDDHDNDDEELTEEWILVTRAPTPSESELSMIVHWAASGASSMKSGANSAMASSSFSASAAALGGVGTGIDDLASSSATGGSGRKTSSARKRHHMVADLDSSAAENEAGARENQNAATSSLKHSGQRNAKSRAVMANGLNEDGSESENENGTAGEQMNGAAGASASDLDSDGYGSELAFLVAKQMNVQETSSQNMPYMM